MQPELLATEMSCKLLQAGRLDTGSWRAAHNTACVHRSWSSRLAPAAPMNLFDMAPGHL